MKEPENGVAQPIKSTEMAIRSCFDSQSVEGSELGLGSWTIPTSKLLTSRWEPCVSRKASQRPKSLSRNDRAGSHRSYIRASCLPASIVPETGSGTFVWRPEHAGAIGLGYCFPLSFSVLFCVLSALRVIFVWMGLNNWVHPPLCIRHLRCHISSSSIPIASYSLSLCFVASCFLDHFRFVYPTLLSDIYHSHWWVLDDIHH